MFLVPIALIVIVIYLTQFMGWVALFYIHTEVVLDDIVNKLQYSIFYMKNGMNRVPVYIITSILSLK